MNRRFFLFVSTAATLGCKSVATPDSEGVERPRASLWQGARPEPAPNKTERTVDLPETRETQLQSELSSLYAQVLRGSPEVRSAACDRLGQLASTGTAPLAAAELLNNVVQFDPDEKVRATATDALARVRNQRATPATTAEVPSGGPRLSFLRRFWQ